MKFLKRLAKKLIRVKEKYQKKVIIKERANISLKTKLEGKNVINSRATINNSFIGLGTYIGENSFISNTKIGRYCSIASNVRTVLGNHPTSEFVSTHPAFFSTAKQAGFTYVKENVYKELKYADENNGISVIIGNDVWIGENVLILEGVTIGDGAIIGAGSIVTKDIEPFSINVGTPAKKIKYRFEKEEIEFLQDLKWWEKREEWIRENCQYFKNIKLLIERNEKN